MLTLDPPALLPLVEMQRQAPVHANLVAPAKTPQTGETARSGTSPAIEPEAEPSNALGSEENAPPARPTNAGFRPIIAASARPATETSAEPKLDARAPVREPDTSKAAEPVGSEWKIAIAPEGRQPAGKRAPARTIAPSRAQPRDATAVRVPEAAAPVARVEPMQAPRVTVPVLPIAAPAPDAPFVGVASPSLAAVAGAQPAAAGTPQGMPAPIDQMLDMELDLARETEWLDRLTREIVRAGGGDGPMRFRLTPEHLGHLRVEITQGETGASVRLTAETEAARAILAEAQPRLMTEARAQGARIADAQVDLAGSDTGGRDPRRDADTSEPAVRTAGRTRQSPDEADGPRQGTDRYA
jgi:flagellar hook-length control protein FliK